MRAGSPLCEAATGMLSVPKAPLSKLTRVSQHSSPQAVQAVTCFLGLHFFCAHCGYKIIISDHENQLQDYENQSWGERKRPHSSRMRGWGTFSPEHMNSILERNESQAVSTQGNIWGVRTKGLLNDNQSFYQPMTVAKCFCCKTVVWHMLVSLPKKT